MILMARPDPKLFIVWSTKYKHIAEQIKQVLLEKRKKGFPVFPIMFNIQGDANVNEDMHRSLIDAMNDADYALVIMTPDEEVIRRNDGNSMGGFFATCRPNVYFEYGYLSKHIPKNKIFVYNTHGLTPASDTASLVMNYMQSPTGIDEIVKLPKKIAQGLENHFIKKEKEYYLNLNNTDYEIKYEDVFHDFTISSDKYKFVINNSINLGKYWRHELSRFPKDDLYHIGRKIIYILERAPFNVYLYSSTDVSSFKDSLQVFIDDTVIRTLNKNINNFIRESEEPIHLRDYRIYKASEILIEVIESYQSKRNKSTDFSFKKDCKYNVETSKLFGVGEYITQFPLNQLLYNRYLALCLHKDVFSMFGIENVDSEFKSKLIKYFENKNNSKNNEGEYLSIIKLSMAITYIQKTIDYSLLYDRDNIVELHRSLALFDRARMEYIFEILINVHKHNDDTSKVIGKIKKDILNKIKEGEVCNTINFLHEYITQIAKSKLEKSIDYALIAYFDELHSKNNRITIKPKNIKLISKSILEALNKEINLYKINDIIDDNEKLNNTSFDYLNPINSKWRDVEFDILITKILSFYEVRQDNIYKFKGFISKEVEDAITKELATIDSTIGKEISIIVKTNIKDLTQYDDKKMLKYLYSELYRKLFDNLFQELQQNIDKHNCTETWDDTILSAMEVRENNWKHAVSWPPNMKTILLYECIHAESEHYIYKISDMHKKMSDIHKKMSATESVPNYKEQDALRNEYNTLEEEHKKLIKKLKKMKTKLEHTKEIMQSNYELPDLFDNVLNKIDNYLSDYRKTEKKKIEKNKTEKKKNRKDQT